MFQHLRNDDEGAWDDFNRKYRPIIERWARGCGFYKADADDLASQLILQMVRILPSFNYDRGKGGFRAYWHRALRNLAGKQAVKEAQNQKLHGELHRLLNDSDARNTLLVGLVRAEEIEQKNSAIAEARRKMGNGYWLTWHLTVEQDLSGKEAADQMGITVELLNTRKSRFLQEVKGILRRLNNEPNDG